MTSAGAMEVGSAHSLQDQHEIYNPLPTPPCEKKATTIKRLSYVLGFLYSSFLIILAVIVLSTTALINDKWSPIITIYITVSGLIILGILIMDVKLFTRRIRKQVEALRNKEEKRELDYLREYHTHLDENGSNLNNSNELDVSSAFIPPAPVRELEHIEHSYCFAEGRHAGSVYLKLGAAEKCILYTGFALGHFVHTVLLVVTVHWRLAVSNAQCINVSEYAAGLLQCFYCFLQLFFIFNYSNLIIVKHTNILRVAFLHVMAGNICLWFAAVTTETRLAYRAYEILQVKQITNNTTNTSVLPATADFSWQETCRPTVTAAKIYDEFSAYLYPFTVEFNILVVGIFFMVWRSIGKCRHSAEEVQNFHHSLYAQSNVSGDVNSPHALEIHISCRSAFCGLFSSLFTVVILIVAIILSFVLGNIRNEEFQHISQYFVDTVKLTLHIVMLVTSGIVFYKTQSLDINKRPVPWLDDVLLYICVPAFFLESMLTVIPAITTLNIVKFLDTIMMSLQMVIQIVFIIDGLRRCSNSRKIRRIKPGREFVLYLLVANVSMWVMYTFSYQSPESKDVRYEYYGKEMWLAIGHLCQPIIMFFRFHSSVCIADIWTYAYKPEIEDH
ncbi:proton channel OtopLc-like [Cydia amplana]|uniref:proton channel OtopLc-like n=1 Tax=Cydia amplana TaxID=1869771 RepID=UPI002FE5B51C